MKQLFDLAIIGSGPAGLSAAIKANHFNINTILIDEQFSVGGQVFRSFKKKFPLNKILYSNHIIANQLINEFEQSNVHYLPHSEVIEIEKNGTICYQKNNNLHSIQAKNIIIAAGSIERPFPIEGWTLPGVMTVGAAQILMKSSGLIAKEPVVFAGTGPLLYLTAYQYIKLGGKISVILDTTPVKNYLKAIQFIISAFFSGNYIFQGLKYLFYLRKKGIKIVFNVESLKALGQKEINRVEFDKKNILQSINTKHLFLHQGVIPNIQLTLSLGCNHFWDKNQLCWRPSLDENYETSVNNIFSIGDSSGIVGAHASQLQGELVIAKIAKNLDIMNNKLEIKNNKKIISNLKKDLRIRPFLEKLYEPSKKFLIPNNKKTIICRCEEVTLEQIIEIINFVKNDCNELKSFVRCGMGPCQGRMCGSTISQILSKYKNIEINKIQQFRIVAPIKPVQLNQY